MRALCLTQYGPPANLSITDVPKPVAKGDKVLVRVHAASVNDWDWSMVTGKPAYIRMICGLKRPKIGVPGVDVAGEVEAVGENVSALKPGDRVYGDLSNSGFGAFADYAAVPESALTPMPDSMSFVEAAALPHAGLLALQGLRLAGLEAGQRVLINGAGGGVGTLGAQIARHMGITDLTGVDHGDKFGMMRSVGYTDLIDYTKTDFTRTGERWDIVLDTRTFHPPTAYLRALQPGGTYVTVGGKMRYFLPLLAASPVLKAMTGKHLRLLGLDPNKGLEETGAMYEADTLRPVIDGPYPFEELPKAIARFGAARHLGKLVVTMQ